ncbi:MAG: DUF3099 domain-containing protein [Candidatus Nanopelagicales bacterium]
MAVGDPNSGDAKGERFAQGRSNDDQVYRITSAPESAKLERQARTRRYLISMGIRTLCFIGAIVTTGPLRWVFVACAIGLPYIAVVLANSPVRKTEPDEIPPFIVNQTAQLTDAESFLKACDEASKRAE